MENKTEKSLASTAYDSFQGSTLKNKTCTHTPTYRHTQTNTIQP